jgi:hypothetical protein
MSLTYFSPGDTLWFCGRGFASRSIAFGTCSFKQVLLGQLISHCGFIAQHRGKLKHFESTTFNDLACDEARRKVLGVQVNDPHKRIMQYSGRVYLARPRRALTNEQRAALSISARAFLGTPYDMPGALRAGTRWIKRFFDADPSALFCDEFAAFALMDCGKIPEGSFNPSAVTPAWLARWLVHNAVYRPLVRLK